MHKLNPLRATLADLHTIITIHRVVDAYRLAMWAAAPVYLPDSAVTVLPAPGPPR